jgi:hypothetical protein
MQAQPRVARACCGTALIVSAAQPVRYANGSGHSAKLELECNRILAWIGDLEHQRRS